MSHLAAHLETMPRRMYNHLKATGTLTLEHRAYFALYPGKISKFEKLWGLPITGHVSSLLVNFSALHLTPLTFKEHYYDDTNTPAHLAESTGDLTSSYSMTRFNLVLHDGDTDLVKTQWVPKNEDLMKSIFMDIHFSSWRHGILPFTCTYELLDVLLAGLKVIEKSDCEYVDDTTCDGVRTLLQILYLRQAIYLNDEAKFDEVLTSCNASLDAYYACLQYGRTDWASKFTMFEAEPRKIFKFSKLLQHGHIDEADKIFTPDLLEDKETIGHYVIDSGRVDVVEYFRKRFGCEPNPRPRDWHVFVKLIDPDRAFMDYLVPKVDPSMLSDHYHLCLIMFSKGKVELVTWILDRLRSSSPPWSLNDYVDLLTRRKNTYNPSLSALLINSGIIPHVMLENIYDRLHHIPGLQRQIREYLSR